MANTFTVTPQYHNGSTFIDIPTIQLMGTSSYGSGVTTGSKILYWHNPSTNKLNYENTTQIRLKVVAALGNTTPTNLTNLTATELTAIESTASKGDVKVTYTIA